VDFSHLASLQYPPEINTNDFLYCPCDDDTNLYKFWTTNNNIPPILHEYLKKDGEETEKQHIHFFRGEGGVGDQLDEGMRRYMGGNNPIFISKKMKYDDESIENEFGGSGGGGAWKTGKKKGGNILLLGVIQEKQNILRHFVCLGKYIFIVGLRNI
jgi:hypothetical protein